MMGVLRLLIVCMLLCASSAFGVDDTPTPTPTDTETPTPTATATATPTPTHTPGANDCCACGDFCWIPSTTHKCGVCTVVFGAVCTNDGCSTPSPTSTPLNTATPTSTPTVTLTPTVTATPPATSTPTPTYLVYATPVATWIAPINPGLSSFDIIPFSVQSTPVSLVPVGVGHRAMVGYLDVVADGATTVTVTVPPLSFPFVFAADLSHQRVTFAAPWVPTTTQTIYATQSGTAAVTITIGSAQQ